MHEFNLLCNIMKKEVCICWFRRDLRLRDNAALYYALKSGTPVIPVFIFDSNILEALDDKQDSRVTFIYQAIKQLQEQLIKMGSTMEVYYGTPENVFNTLCTEYNIKAVYTNHDYEPYARERDEKIAQLLAAKKTGFHTYKDQVIFEKKEVVKDNGAPYTVFTPYARKWKATLTDFYTKPYPTERCFSQFLQQPAKPIPGLAAMGFMASEISFPTNEWDTQTITQYTQQRDIPSVNGTSRLSVHLRFGTTSIRQLAREAGSLNETFLNELIWRDFYQMILWHFPEVVYNSFKKEYDNIQWRNNEKEFEAWCNGETGYPIVDAGMRELNATGYMHNRVRMIVASFLTKHLLIDWRWGEAYFAKKLLDYDLAANNGGWQWAAGSGCDAAPYFRIFNPYLQTQKFDAKLTYIRKWIPELDELTYPLPIVEHEVARKRCLEVYGKALKK